MSGDKGKVDFSEHLEWLVLAGLTGEVEVDVVTKDWAKYYVPDHLFRKHRRIHRVSSCEFMVLADLEDLRALRGDGHVFSVAVSHRQECGHKHYHLGAKGGVGK